MLRLLGHVGTGTGCVCCFCFAFVFAISVRKKKKKEDGEWGRASRCLWVSILLTVMCPSKLAKSGV